MFSGRSTFSRGWNTLGSIRNSFCTYCDAADEENTPSLVEQVIALLIALVNVPVHTP